MQVNLVPKATKGDQRVSRLVLRMSEAEEWGLRVSEAFGWRQTWEFREVVYFFLFTFINFFFFSFVIMKRNWAPLVKLSAFYFKSYINRWLVVVLNAIYTNSFYRHYKCSLVYGKFFTVNKVKEESTRTLYLTDKISY